MKQRLFNNRYRFATFVLVVFAVSACTSVNKVLTPKDGAPRATVNPDLIKDAIPREGRVTRAGNKNPYTILGKTYHLLPTSAGYKQRGVASWYGTKFHGRPTANGERYSLYAMTAAHRTLPIPAYVKVTNLENNRTAIVRVNDRGPFHDNRIIDLSYVAAVKLGFAERGTARVEVEVIEPAAPAIARAQPEAKANTAAGMATAGTATNTAAKVAIDVAANVAANVAKTAANNERFFLQVGAFRSLELANKLRDELLSLTRQEVNIRASEPAGFYRVQIGPLAELTQVQQVSEQLLQLNMGQPRLISE